MITAVSDEVYNLLKELQNTLLDAEAALRLCYQVADYPADGNSSQDEALATVRASLKKLDSLL